MTLRDMVSGHVGDGLTGRHDDLSDDSLGKNNRDVVLLQLHRLEQKQQSSWYL